MKVTDFYERFKNVPVDERADYVWHLTPEEWGFVKEQIATMPVSEEELRWRMKMPPMLLGRPVIVEDA